MLFRVEARTERDDFRGLATIAQAYDEAFKALSENKEEEADGKIKSALYQVRTSPDLTHADRKRIAKGLREEYDEAKQEGLGAVTMKKSMETTIK